VGIEVCKQPLEEARQGVDSNLETPEGSNVAYMLILEANPGGR
jgi:hypothetical protein